MTLRCLEKFIYPCKKLEIPYAHSIHQYCLWPQVEVTYEGSLRYWCLVVK